MSPHIADTLDGPHMSPHIADTLDGPTREPKAGRTLTLRAITRGSRIVGTHCKETDTQNQDQTQTKHRVAPYAKHRNN